MAIAALKTSTEIDTNLILREQFWNSLFDSGKIDWIQAQNALHDYVQNMVESDYNLCARGAGNFSYRFYETLSCGCIPVFVDTDCVFLFHNDIDLKTYCVWVDEKDVASIGERVAEFHSSLSEQDFVNLQHNSRRLEKSYLAPEGFFENFHLEQ